MRSLQQATLQFLSYPLTTLCKLIPPTTHSKLGNLLYITLIIYTNQLKQTSHQYIIVRCEMLKSNEREKEEKKRKSKKESK